MIAGVHILVIDDDERRGERMARPPASWGWDVTRLSGDPRAALARLSQEPFDLVLLSLEAAERDDYDFLRRRRHDPHAAAVPVVITAWPGVSSRRLAACVEHGAGDYITHPNQHALLRARLQNVLQRKLLQEQANTALEAFNEIEKIADDLRLVILPIGAALSAETEFDHLIARIVAEAQAICNADTGALFLVRDDGMLYCAYLHVRPLDYTYQGQSGADELFMPIPLTDPETDEPNYRSLAVYVALTGESVNLTEVHSGRFELLQLARVERALGFRNESALAVPLRSGQVVGTLMLANSRHPLNGQPVPFEAYHQQVAESLASQAAVVINNRLLNERQSQLMRYKRELEIGREIQLSFLPARLPGPDGWELVARFRPALEVAGDFYDAFRLPHGYLVIVIADVVGKGVTAALFMAIIRSLFRALFQQHYYAVQPAPATAADGRTAPFPFVDRDALLSAVRLTNAYLIANHGDAYAFATLFAGVLDPANGRLLYVNAGHNPPLVLGPVDGGRAVRKELSPTGPAIGLLLNADYRLSETTLEPDDLLFAFTDGVTEARNPTGEELGQERVEAILAARDGTAEEALAAVESAVLEHTAEAEAFDDVTMLALRRL